jgi:hypothetical protein
MSEDLRESQARDQECLVLFEKHPHMDAYKYGGSFTPYAIVGVDKRFTDGELAAEFHAARADYAEAVRHPSGTYWTPLGVEEDNTAAMATKRATTFLHFSIRKHFDE